MNDAWAAGIIEGEGYFGTINRTYESKKKGTTHYEYPCVSVSMTDKDVVESLHRIMGVGYITRSRAATDKWKEQWAWRCAKQSDWLKVVERVYPYLHSRRRTRVDELLEKFA